MNLPTVPCVWCGEPTTYLGTKHCDPCHQLINRLRDVSDDVLDKMLVARIVEKAKKINGTSSS
jgi:DNA-binding IscR family transcriptional regulator